MNIEVASSPENTVISLPATSQIIGFNKHLYDIRYFVIMSDDDSLREAIANSRKVSEDGSLVTYDLTEGIDFSNPKKSARVLAEVFFEKDAVNWFTVSDDHIQFNPTYKVRIVLAEDHNKKLEETVDDFLKDLKEHELDPKFVREIDDSAERASRLRAAMFAHTFTTLLNRRYVTKIDREYFQDDLLTDILEKLEIRSLNNDDLMDWKHLPL